MKYEINYCKLHGEGRTEIVEAENDHEAFRYACSNMKGCCGFSIKKAKEVIQ